MTVKRPWMQTASWGLSRGWCIQTCGGSQLRILPGISNII